MIGKNYIGGMIITTAPPSIIIMILTLMFLLVHTDWSLCTPADDKPPLHRTVQTCRNTLPPIVHCYRPPVYQRSILFGLRYLPALGLHLKGIQPLTHINLIASNFRGSKYSWFSNISRFVVYIFVVAACTAGEGR